MFVDSGIFTKTGGTIDNTNSAASGKVAHVLFGGVKARNTTAGPAVDLNNNIAGSAGGWE
ncbi:hypothetical protein FACS189473_0790 [Spirochaetia bacterium]|nr:hypothetical protein FACS189473_0790 [Spirochaetia bacterium]